MDKKESFSDKHPRLNTIIGFLLFFLLLGLAILILYVVFKYLGIASKRVIEYLKDSVSKLDAVIIVALITGGVSITGVVLTSIVAKTLEFRQRRREYLYQKREQPYADFVGVVYKIQEAAKTKEKYSQEEILADMMSFSEKLTLWGSNRVIKKWLKFRALSGDEEEPSNVLYIMEDILYAMRKDMGLKKLKKGKLLSFFVNDLDSDKNEKR